MTPKLSLVKLIERYKDFPVIVEGPNDKNALVGLGFSDVYVMHGKPIYKFIDDFAEKNKIAVILTDLDSEGKKFYKLLNEGLSSLGVKIDDNLRKFLFKETTLRQIEGLLHYIETHPDILED